MNKLNIALIGYGTVGQGVAKWLKKYKALLKEKSGVDFHLRAICDRSIHKKDASAYPKAKLTKNIDEVLKDPDIHVVIELIGGMDPAKRIVKNSLKSGKHVITANKELIANSATELFEIANEHKTLLYFESAVGAGIPIIKTITEGIAGNNFNGVYGIINGTCNFILDEMTQKGLSFDDALKDAQAKGYAESDPTLDINGMDSAHKLAILVHLAFGKQISVKDIYVEGITDISYADIEFVNNLNLCIKLLAIAKKHDNKIEARVHPTLITKDHPLASIDSIYNAIYVETEPFGNLLLSGEGAGQMAAASGIISDLINLATKTNAPQAICNNPHERKDLKLQSIDHIETKFYIRLKAEDKPGVLSQVTGILGKQGISINSVSQKAHDKTQSIPVIMLTEYTTEKKLRMALNKIQKLSSIKGKPVAIRLEKLAKW